MVALKSRPRPPRARVRGRVYGYLPYCIISTRYPNSRTEFFFSFFYFFFLLNRIPGSYSSTVPGYLGTRYPVVYPVPGTVVLPYRDGFLQHQHTGLRIPPPALTFCFGFPSYSMHLSGESGKRDAPLPLRRPDVRRFVRVAVPRRHVARRPTGHLTFSTATPTI